jgi:hypothetical protein
MPPGGVAQPGVDRLAVVEVVRENLAGRSLPRLVGGDGLHMPVREDDLELRIPGSLVSVHRPLACEAEPASPPAVAEPQADRGALRDRIRHVVLDESHAPFITGPARCQQLVRGRNAVDPRLDHAQGTRTEDGPLDGAVALVECELSS